jgi:hypothetical protein
LFKTRSASVSGMSCVKEMFAVIVQNVLQYSWLCLVQPREDCCGWTVGYASPSGASLKPLYFFVNIGFTCSPFHTFTTISNSIHCQRHNYSHMSIRVNIVIENGKLRSSKTGMSWLGCYCYCSVHRMLPWLFLMQLAF